MYLLARCLLQPSALRVQGGFIQKPAQWIKADKPWLLAVEDPQDPGRDMASGSHAMPQASAFERREPWSLQGLHWQP